MHDGQPLVLSPGSASASPEEAAAIVAALERFMRATAPTQTTPVEDVDGWRRAAILEGISREPQDDAHSPYAHSRWINT